MLTARGRPEDVLRGFESGADDYLPKPFELEILLARLRGLLRRRDWQRGAAAAAASNLTAAPTSQEGAVEPVTELFSLGRKTIDFGSLEIRLEEQRATVRLTLMEAELLRYLIRREGKIVSRKQILEDVWGLHEDTDTRAIDNFIVRLRRYLEDEPSQPKHLLTVRGVGYRFVANA
ncbi:MAG: response regulator transcription factor [Pyrinomonadaceae bacterium]